MEVSIVRQLVVDELQAMPNLDADGITVAESNGTVTLCGHVGSASERLTAVRAAQRVTGGFHVVDHLAVDQAPRMVVPDTDLATRASKLLEWDVMLPKGTISVRVKGGHVTLQGHVHALHQRRRAEDEITNLAGVTGVTNHIEVEPVVRPDDLQRRICGADLTGSFWTGLTERINPD